MDDTRSLELLKKDMDRLNLIKKIKANLHIIETPFLEEIQKKIIINIKTKD